MFYVFLSGSSLSLSLRRQTYRMSSMCQQAKKLSFLFFTCFISISFLSSCFILLFIHFLSLFSRHYFLVIILSLSSCHRESVSLFSCHYSLVTILLSLFNCHCSLVIILLCYFVIYLLYYYSCDCVFSISAWSLWLFDRLLTSTLLHVLHFLISALLSLFDGWYWTCYLIVFADWIYAMFLSPVIRQGYIWCDGLGATDVLLETLCHLTSI